MDNYFSTTISMTIPEGVAPVLEGYDDLTLSLAEDGVTILCSGPAFGSQDNGKILWCNNELRTIMYLNSFNVLVNPAFTTPPVASAFQIISPVETKTSVTCTVNSFICTPDGVESTFIANTTVGITALAVAIRPAAGAIVAGTYNP